MNDHPFTYAAFQQNLDNQTLTGARCQTCGAIHLPPHPLCPRCLGHDLKLEALAGRGVLIAFTVVHVAPTFMVNAGYGPQHPYVSGIVKLDEGPAISAQITGVAPEEPQTIVIGASVQVVFINREGSEHKALAFRVLPS
jgi:uncharacterized OB-fold protein